jgi:hypothetical protein
MRTLLIILGCSIAVFADIGVVAYKNSVPVAKDVFAGDTSNVSALVQARQANDTTLSFKIFDLGTEAQMLEFEAIKLQATKNQKAKDKLKTNGLKDSEKIDAIIEYLGLDQ